MVKKTVEITKPPSGSPGGGFFMVLGREAGERKRKGLEGKQGEGFGKKHRESRRKTREKQEGRSEYTLKGVRNKYGKRQGCVAMLRYSL